MRESGFQCRQCGHCCINVSGAFTVCNRTETAARVKHAFDTRRIHIDELCDPERILHVDSKVLQEAEEREEPVAPVETTAAEGDDGEESDAPMDRKLTKAEQAELLRRTVDTVGKVGQPGAGIQKVISVGMLSEGWDAKTVTHIMGLRAFSSQLLCEQVVGRGLRRTSYETNPDTGLFDPEYVNIFGVPFTFLPHEGGEDGPPPPPDPKTAIEPDPAKSGFEIRWPNVVRIERVFVPTLALGGCQGSGRDSGHSGAASASIESGLVLTGNRTYRM